MLVRMGTTIVYSSDVPTLPADIIAPILEQVSDRRDLTRCALVNSLFHRAVIPILYRTLDVRTRRVRDYDDKVLIVHPSKTLLRRPEYAKYVRYIREAATVGLYEPQLMPGCREALIMCKNLRSFTWVDDAHDSNNDENFPAYLDILQKLPHVSELIIRTSVGISDEVWDKMTEFTKLQKIAIWCLHGKPRILQGWSEKLGSSLTHLELGVSCLSRQYTNFLSHLPKLKTLRLKGAPSNAIPEILAVLPNLESLDTEYLGSGRGRSLYDNPSVASLRELTVRTSSVDVQGPPNLWPWISSLVPRESLETLTLHTFSTQGDMSMPRMFLLDLAKTHKQTLKHFNVDTVQLTLQDVECLCTMYPNLESISCSLAWCTNHNDIKEAIANGHNLRKLQLHVHWGSFSARTRFTAEQAKEWMLCENSRLREVTLGGDVYVGKWVRRPLGDGKTELEFEVERNMVRDNWI